MGTQIRRPKRVQLGLRGPHETFLNDPREATNMRAFVSVALTTAEVPEHIADEILMAVGEAVANACRHGHRPTRPGEVGVSCHTVDSSVSVAVSDEGPGFDLDAVLGAGTPDLLASGGRGFFLMQQLMDRVDVEVNAHGTTVTLGRDLPR